MPKTSKARLEHKTLKLPQRGSRLTVGGSDEIGAAAGSARRLRDGASAGDAAQTSLRHARGEATLTRSAELTNQSSGTGNSDKESTFTFLVGSVS